MDNSGCDYRTIDPKIRKMSMIGLCLAMLIACFDGTIVGTCGPVIAADLDGFGLYSWMVTAYLLCETVTIPIAGKLSDLYGRKPLFLIGLFLFMAGSVIAGMSSSMEMLIFCRAIQGLGGGTLIPVAVAAVGDFYPPHQRAKMQGILGALFGIGSGVGPLIGGYIAETISWHWIFYINVPLAIVCFFLTIKKFPAPLYVDEHKIDVAGIAVLSLLLIDVLLFFELGGKNFPWVSLESLGMVALAFVLVAAFVYCEKRAIEPIIAPKLIHNRIVIKASIFMLIFGLGMMGVMTYAALFAKYAFDLDTLTLGLYFMALVAGMMITSMSSGMLCERTGFRPWLVGGPIVCCVGMVMLAQMTTSSPIWYYLVCLFIFGLGLGCIMSVVMTAVQNTSESNEMGMTTSCVNLIRSVGATVGTAVFAMIINNKLSGELVDVLGPLYDVLPHDTSILNYLIAPGMEPYANGIVSAFISSVDFAFIIGALILMILIPLGIIFKTSHLKNEKGYTVIEDDINDEKNVSYEFSGTQYSINNDDIYNEKN